MTQINAYESYDGSFTFRILCPVRYETYSSPLYKQCPGRNDYSLIAYKTMTK